MDLFIYKEIAKKDAKIWELFNMLNKSFNTEFAIGGDEYMEAFKEPEYADASIKIGYDDNDSFLDFASLYPKLVIVGNSSPVGGMYSTVKHNAIRIREYTLTYYNDVCATFGDTDTIGIVDKHNWGNAIAIGNNVTNITFKNTRFAPFATEKYKNNPDDIISHGEKYKKAVNHSNVIKKQRQREIKHFKQPKPRKHFNKH